MRPPTSRVVALLAGEFEVSSVTVKPSYLTDWDFKDTTGSFIIEDTLTSFVSSNNNIRNSRKYKTITREEPMLSPVNVTEFNEFEEGR
ncbi:hypothetical protein CCACVL1_11528 [Corchorus capsularis]|uniref:Uncharacterized protein n=1 Tax=Corchorus capsularis TaxID=210143 RepID=A0A1R3IKR0_COCAP|nr:hypothetical protein CCACVL1_11528 [Corchorus capsularis]